MVFTIMVGALGLLAGIFFMISVSMKNSESSEESRQPKKNKSKKYI